MQFDPKVSFWLGVVVTALIGIGGGTVSLTHAIPPDWIPTVVAWCNILSFLGSGLLTALHGFSSGSSGPFVAAPPISPPKLMIAFLAVALAALALGSASPAGAQNRPPATPGHSVPGAALTGDPIRDIGNAVAQGGAPRGGTPSSPLDELAAKIRKLSLDDFKYAAALAHATGNTVTSPCWDEWVKLLTAQQQPLNGPDGQPLKEPDPHLATDIERLSEMVAQLQPRSELSVACAPMATTAQKDAATLIGAVLSGGAMGLFKLPFAIP
jgi:hypothetical protein